MSLRLHQFERSHFNEKARWALDYKNLECERETYLPGPHMPTIKKISGQAQTPVLELDGEYIAGSARIIDRLESLHPSPPLYPTDSSEREAALAVQSHFDDVVGPAVRTVLFSVLINDGDYLCQMFSESKSRLKRIAYRAAFPAVRGVIAKGNGVDDPANIAHCFEITAATLDDVAARIGDTGYMVGDQFSVADLAAAALLAPLADVSHPDMRRAQPVPDEVAELVDRYASHATMLWVARMYEAHR